MTMQQEFHAYTADGYYGIVMATPEQLAEMGFTSGEPPPPPSPAAVIAQARAAMAISPLQGILTLGETEWGKVLAYRETATWAEKVVIDHAGDWQRTSQNIAFFGYLLGYTDEQMDALFTAAAQVRA